MKGHSEYLVGEGEADSLPPLDGDRDDQEDGGGEGKVTRALQDGEQEAEGLNLGSITVIRTSRYQPNSESIVTL